MKKETAQIIFEGGQNAAMLQAIADILGKQITVWRIGDGSAADVVKIGDDKLILSPRIADTDDQIAGPWSMSYSIDADSGRVSWVFLGHKLLGPCYQCGDDGQWCNCYSHGDFGKNHASGGTWSSAPGAPKYTSLDDCIEGRKVEMKNGKDQIFIRYAAIPGIEPELI